MPKYDKEYVEGFEMAKDELKDIDKLLKHVYNQAGRWLGVYPWQTAEDGEMRAVALNMERLVDKADQSRATVDAGLLRVERLI